MGLIKLIFISPEETRLRAGWRLILQIIFMVILSACLLIPWVFIQGQIPSSRGLLAFQVVELIGVTLSIILARRFLDRRSVGSLGLMVSKQSLIDVLVGIGITFFMMGLIYLVEYGLGWLTFIRYAWDVDSLGMVISQILVSVLAFVLVGWNEELLSRGYHLQNLADGLNLFWGVVLSSVGFGLLHIANPNASWISSLGIFLAGVFLAYGYLRTLQLWLPIGLHIGWNIFEGVIFGFPVSGMETYRLIQTSVNGPDLWTGGAFGPEAGLVVVPALLLGALMVWAYTRCCRGNAISIGEGTIPVTTLPNKER